MAMVTLKSVSKLYNRHHKAVADFSMTIKDEEFVVLVGPSGCGKSSTLRMIAGLEHVSEGEIWIDTKLVNNIQAKNRNISMVFQNYALYPHLTVYKNISFGLEVRGVKKEVIHQKVHSVAALLEIESLLERKPDALSGGERQRVAIGRSIVREPAVFLFDEPLSNLDATLKATMRSELIDLHKRLRATFIYVTHDQIEALTMADRVVVMNKGLIEQIGTPDTIYHKPETLFVATFIGSPPMNILKGIVYHVEDKAVFQMKHLTMNLPDCFQPADGTKISVGIRPEHLFTTSQKEQNLLTQIKRMERIGSEILLYTQIDDVVIICKEYADVRYENGETVEMSFSWNQVVFFDEEGNRMER